MLQLFLVQGFSVSDQDHRDWHLEAPEPRARSGSWVGIQQRCAGRFKRSVHQRNTANRVLLASDPSSNGIVAVVELSKTEVNLCSIAERNGRHANPILRNVVGKRCKDLGLNLFHGRHPVIACAASFFPVA